MRKNSAFKYMTAIFKKNCKKYATLKKKKHEQSKSNEEQINVFVFNNIYN